MRGSEHEVWRTGQQGRRCQCTWVDLRIVRVTDNALQEFRRFGIRKRESVRGEGRISEKFIQRNGRWPARGKSTGKGRGYGAVRCGR